MRMRIPSTCSIPTVEPWKSFASLEELKIGTPELEEIDVLESLDDFCPPCPSTTINKL